MMKSQHLGFGYVLLAVCFVGMVAIAQGPPEPTLALLRSGARRSSSVAYPNTTPFNVVGPDGQLTGMDREIIRAAAKRLGIKQVDFKTMMFSKLGQSLLDGKIASPTTIGRRPIESVFTPSPCRTSCEAAWAHCGSRGPDRSTPRPAWPGSVSPS